MQATNSPHAMWFIMVTTCPFYYVLLEQYYTGEMNFPPINAVDDGIFIYVGLAILTGAIGSEKLWTALYPVFGTKQRLVDIVRVFLNILMPIFACIAFKNIYLKFNSEHTKKLWDTKYFVAQVAYWLISFTTFSLAMYFSVGEIWKTHNRAMQLGHGLQFLYVTLMY